MNLEERQIGFYYPYQLFDDLAGFEATAAMDNKEGWNFKCEVLGLDHFPSCKELENLLKKHITTSTNYDKLTSLEVYGMDVNNGQIDYLVKYVFSKKTKYDCMTLYLY